MPCNLAPVPPPACTSKAEVNANDAAGRTCAKIEVTADLEFVETLARDATLERREEEPRN